MCTFHGIFNLTPFSPRDGGVICRQLGYLRALNVSIEASFGLGAGPVWLSGLQCTGNEERISQCTHDGWGLGGCGHEEDAGVMCTGMFDDCMMSRCHMMSCRDAATACINIISLNVQMSLSSQSDWLMGTTQPRVVWRSSTMERGGRSATTNGMLMTPWWFVDTWVSLEHSRPPEERHLDLQMILPRYG